MSCKESEGCSKGQTMNQRFLRRGGTIRFCLKKISGIMVKRGMVGETPKCEEGPGEEPGDRHLLP